MSGGFSDMVESLGASPEQMRLRQAALMLHAHSPQDRQWLLERLEPAEQQALGPLLAELQALQIHAQVARLADALPPVPSSASPPASPPPLLASSALPEQPRPWPELSGGALAAEPESLVQAVRRLQGVACRDLTEPAEPWGLGAFPMGTAFELPLPPGLERSLIHHLQSARPMPAQGAGSASRPQGQSGGSDLRSRPWWGCWRVQGLSWGVGSRP